jgi:hypothetical protein
MVMTDDGSDGLREKRLEPCCVLRLHNWFDRCSGQSIRMLRRSPDTDAFWQSFRRYAGLDHVNYVVGSFGDSPEMPIELADLVMAGTKRATASLGTRLRRWPPDTEARRFCNHARRRRASTVYLANDRGND